MKKRILIQKTLESIKSANTKYENWSGGAWLSDYGAEGLLVAEIADRLIKEARKTNKSAFLTVEESFISISDCSYSDPKKGKKHNVINGNKRADIVLWKNMYTVWGVIEVKRKWDNDKCIKDIERLDKLIKTYGSNYNGSLEYACLAVFMYKNQDPDGDKLKAQYTNIKKYLIKKKFERFRINTIEPYFTSGKKFPNNTEYSKGGLVLEFY